MSMDMNIEVYRFDTQNNEHVNFLLSCLQNDEWRKWCSVRVNKSEPLLLSLFRYIYSRVQSPTQIFILAKTGGVPSGYAEVFLNGRISTVIGGSAPHLIDKGVGLTLYVMFLHLIWSELSQVDKIVSISLEGNIRLQKINRAIGFVEEGIHRKEFYIHETDEYCNKYHFGMFRDEFFTPVVKRILSRCSYTLKDIIK